MSKRYSFVDNVKGFAIVSVVLGHLFTMVAAADSLVNLDRAVRFLSVYELAAFFVISGFLMAGKAPEAMGLKDHMARRAGKIMPVYLVFSFLYLFQDVTLANVIHVVTGFGISVLWFLPTLMFGEAAWLIVRRLKWAWAQAAVSVFLAAAACTCGLFLQAGGSEGASLFLQAGEKEGVSLWLQVIGCVFVLALRACVGQFFVGVGYALNFFLKKASGRQAAASAFLSLAVGVACSMRVTTADLRIMNIREPVLWLAAASAMSVGLVLVFYGLEKRGLRIWILEQAGRESMLIMCTHLQFGIMPMCITLGYEASAASPRAKGYVLWGVILLCLTAVETVLILIKRHGYKY